MNFLLKGVVNAIKGKMTCLSLASLIATSGCEDSSSKSFDATSGEENYIKDLGLPDNICSIDSEIEKQFNPSGEWILETPFQIQAGSTYENGYDNQENPSCAEINRRGQFQNCDVYLTPEEFGNLGEGEIQTQEDMHLKIGYNPDSEEVRIELPNRFMYADQSSENYSTNIKLQDKKGEGLLYVIGNQEDEVPGCDVEREVILSVDLSNEPTATIKHQVKFVNVEGQIFSCNYLLNMIGAVLELRPKNSAGTVWYPLAINGALNLPNLAAIDTLYYNLESRLIRY
ncbi:MAG: hypothetical protein Q8Q01_03725 [archaeon]|nr:hypothetical protein [archaeon]